MHFLSQHFTEGPPWARCEEQAWFCDLQCPVLWVGAAAPPLSLLSSGSGDAQLRVLPGLRAGPAGKAGPRDGARFPLPPPRPPSPTVRSAGFLYDLHHEPPGVGFSWGLCCFSITGRARARTQRRAPGGFGEASGLWTEGMAGRLSSETWRAPSPGSSAALGCRHPGETSRRGGASGLVRGGHLSRAAGDRAGSGVPVVRLLAQARRTHSKSAPHQCRGGERRAGGGQGRREPRASTCVGSSGALFVVSVSSVLGAGCEHRGPGPRTAWPQQTGRGRRVSVTVTSLGCHIFWSPSASQTHPGRHVGLAGPLPTVHGQPGSGWPLRERPQERF